MPMTYYKTFTVPFWVIVRDNSKFRTIMRWFERKEARLLEWPSRGFKETLLGFKKRGWHHIFPKQDGEHFVIPPQLAMMAVKEHLAKQFGPTAIIEFTYPIHRIDRTIKTDIDYIRIFNQILGTQSPIGLSQLFQVAERCHNDSAAEKEILWVTPAPCVEKVLTGIAERVIRVGEDADCDINISDVSAKQIPSVLESELLRIFDEQGKQVY